MYWHCVLSHCCCYCCCCCVFVLLLFSLCVCCCLCLLLYLSVCCLSWLSCHLCSLRVLWLCGGVAPWCMWGWSGLLAAPFQLMRAIILEHVFARTYVRWSGRATRPAVKRVIRVRVERTEEQNERVFVCSPRRKRKIVLNCLTIFVQQSKKMVGF